VRAIFIEFSGDLVGERIHVLFLNGHFPTDGQKQKP
jgi:hypothetical protein